MRKHNNIFQGWQWAFCSTALCLAAGVAGCQCGKSNIERKGDAVAFEKIRFGGDESAFISDALKLIPLEKKPEKKSACSDSVTMLFPDLEEKTITERSAKGDGIRNCRVRSSHLEKTSTLLEIRGEFLSNKLCRVTFVFDKTRHQSIEASLKARLGEGDTMRLVEQFIIENQEKTYHYWTDDKEIWLLSELGVSPLILVRQDLMASELGLKAPIPAAKKGVPVSLEDLGIGQLDLNATPTLDLKGIPLPDGGVITEKNSK